MDHKDLRVIPEIQDQLVLQDLKVQLDKTELTVRTEQMVNQLMLMRKMLVIKELKRHLLLN